jgi:hypothetical protein
VTAPGSCAWFSAYDRQRRSAPTLFPVSENTRPQFWGERIADSRRLPVTSPSAALPQMEVKGRASVRRRETRAPVTFLAEVMCPKVWLSCPYLSARRQAPGERALGSKPSSQAKQNAGRRRCSVVDSNAPRVAIGIESAAPVCWIAEEDVTNQPDEFRRLGYVAARDTTPPGYYFGLL